MRHYHNLRHRYLDRLSTTWKGCQGGHISRRTRLEKPIWACWQHLMMQWAGLSTIWEGAMWLRQQNHIKSVTRNAQDDVQRGWERAECLWRHSYHLHLHQRSPDTWGGNFKFNLTQLDAEPRSWRWVKRAPERQPWWPLGGGNQDPCLRLKSGQGGKF